MAKAYECDNCHCLYKPYEDVLRLKEHPVRAVRLVTYNGDNSVDLCSTCRIKFAKEIIEYLKTK